MSKPHIMDLRSELLATIREVRSGQMEPDRAKAVSQVAAALIDTARVEVDYLKLAGGDCSDFIDGLKAPEPRDPMPAGLHRTKSGMVQIQRGVVAHSTDVDDQEDT